MTPDPETLKVVEGFQAELDKELNVVIGKTEGPLDSRRNIVRTQEAAIGNLIADAMIEAVGAEIAIFGGGGIRADKEYPAGGDITRRDILTELPFGNVTVLGGSHRPAGVGRARKWLLENRRWRRPLPASGRHEGGG